jgi:hypothetical protein
MRPFLCRFPAVGGLLLLALLCTALIGAQHFRPSMGPLTATTWPTGTAPPTLGNYPDTSIPLSADTTVTPDAAPTNITSINVSTSTNFNGALIVHDWKPLSLAIQVLAWIFCAIAFIAPFSICAQERSWYVIFVAALVALYSAFMGVAWRWGACRDLKEMSNAIRDHVDPPRGLTVGAASDQLHAPNQTTQPPAV